MPKQPALPGLHDAMKKMMMRREQFLSEMDAVVTTAANIWATAGIGLIVGLGRGATAVLSTTIVLIILAVVPYIVPPTVENDTDQNKS